MKVFCPTDGLIEVAPRLDLKNTKNFRFHHFITTCPKCSKRITLKGFFDFDENGVPTASTKGITFKVN